MEESTQIDTAELWQLRAMTSEKKAILAEITILRMKFEDINEEAKIFETMLKEKYQCDSFDIDGNVIKIGE